MNNPGYDMWPALCYGLLAPQTVGRDTRDMRERRDVDRLDSHLVPPISPFPPVSRVWFFHSLLGGYNRCEA